jgi:hypothetical protein
VKIVNYSALIGIVSLFASHAFADEAADRAMIESMLNDRTRLAPDQFTRSAIAASEFVRLTEVERTFAPSEGPFSETTEPRLRVRSIRFLTPEMALVDASINQFSSTGVRSVPVILLMKKLRNWRVEAIRIGGTSLPRLFNAR